MPGIFCRLQILNFFKKLFHEYYQSVKHFGYTEQARCLVGSDQGPNCLIRTVLRI